MKWMEENEFVRAYENAADEFGCLQWPEEKVKRLRKCDNNNDLEQCCRKSKIKWIISNKNAIRANVSIIFYTNFNLSLGIIRNIDGSVASCRLLH